MKKIKGSRRTSFIVTPKMEAEVDQLIKAGVAKKFSDVIRIAVEELYKSVEV